MEFLDHWLCNCDDLLKNLKHAETKPETQGSSHLKKNSCYIYIILYDITYYTRRPKNKLALLRPMIYTLYNIHEGIIEIEHPYSVSLVTGCHNQVQVTVHIS